MDKIAHAVPRQRASSSSPTSREPDKLSLKIYAVMAVTSLLTFGTLATVYQLLFSHQLFA